MSIRSAQAIVVEFITSSPTTGAATNADSLPTGILIISGADNGATVTVTNVTTGRYKAAVTLPTLAVGDIVELVILATVSTIAGKAIVWRDSKDAVLDLTQTLSAARALDAIADTSLTLNDALHCAIAAAAGKESVVGTTYTIETPFTGTILRTFNLDAATNPATRS